MMAVGQKRLDMEDKLLIRAMTSMGGGVGARSGPCGALTGGIALLGSVLGRDEPEVKDNPLLWKACEEYYSRFEKEIAVDYPGVNCRDISGVKDWKDRSQAVAYYKGEGIGICTKSTGKAALILGEVIEKYLPDE
jgi:hypothetical protein